MPHLLPADFVARYARPPSPTTVDQAVKTHQAVRAVLGDAEYATVLQGSYKNDTALWDMNDVDIVAVSRATISRVFTNTPASTPVTWDELFARIERKLQADARYAGRWRREDKCIRLNTGIKIDVVPAVRVGDAEKDPIAIYSFRAGRERQNSPRTHYDNGVRKSSATSGSYKQTVRLIKRWARCWFGTRKVAPSYYLECLVHSQPDSEFTGDLAIDFVRVAIRTLDLRYGQAALPRVAGDGNVLSAGEWEQAAFAEFQNALRAAAGHLSLALGQPSEAQARAYWIAGFNGQQAS